MTLETDSVMLSVIYAECHKCWVSFMLSVTIEPLCAECHYDDCRYAEFRYAESRGAFLSIVYNLKGALNDIKRTYYQFNFWINKQININ